jgi:transcriptional regulator with XRE-family HTH domain
MFVRCLSGVALAREAGIYSQYLSMIECGRVKRIGPEIFARIRDALHVEDQSILLAKTEDAE